MVQDEPFKEKLVEMESVNMDDFDDSEVNIMLASSRRSQKWIHMNASPQKQKHNNQTKINKEISAAATAKDIEVLGSDFSSHLRKLGLLGHISSLYDGKAIYEREFGKNFQEAV